MLLRIDQADDMKKPTLLGLTFLAYCRGYINSKEFLRLSAAINRLFIGNKEDCQSFLSQKACKYDDPCGQDFANAGLARFVAGFDGGYIELNEAGVNFGKYILKS